MSFDEWKGGKDAPAVQNYKLVLNKTDLSSHGKLKGKFKSLIVNVDVDEPTPQSHSEYYENIPVLRKGMNGQYNIRMNEKYILTPLTALAGAKVGIIGCDK